MGNDIEGLSAKNESLKKIGFLMENGQKNPKQSY